MGREIDKEVLEDYWTKIKDNRDDPEKQKEIIKEIWEEAYEQGHEDGQPYYAPEND